jgi:trans-2,3-dihydro-3-hydroxyanthranilate isomerase
MPHTLRFLQLDVFTSTPFEGNQLAVFPDVPDLPAPVMQRIAAEMAFSESTFIFPPAASGDVRMRIFTPGAELPMAGHPTIGSTFALAAEGVIPPGREAFVFELGVGPTDVSLEWAGDALSFAWMTQLRPTFGASARNLSALAAAVGLEISDLDTDHPAQVVSCGVPFFFLPIRTRRGVDAVTVDRRALTGAYAEAGVDELPLFVFTTEPGGGAETAYSRMLAPTFGIAEDPATGGASGPLGCYLLEHGLVSADAARQMLSLQGVAMGRPSRIHISIDGDAGEITRVRVGGQSVVVGRGEIYLR